MTNSQSKLTEEAIALFDGNQHNLKVFLSQLSPRLRHATVRSIKRRMLNCSRCMARGHVSEECRALTKQFEKYFKIVIIDNIAI